MEPPRVHRVSAMRMRGAWPLLLNDRGVASRVTPRPNRNGYATEIRHGARTVQVVVAVRHCIEGSAWRTRRTAPAPPPPGTFCRSHS